MRRYYLRSHNKQTVLSYVNRHDRRQQRRSREDDSELLSLCTGGLAVRLTHSSSSLVLRPLCLDALLLVIVVIKWMLKWPREGAELPKVNSPWKSVSNPNGNGRLILGLSFINTVTSRNTTLYLHRDVLLSLCVSLQKEIMMMVYIYRAQVIQKHYGFPSGGHFNVSLSGSSCMELAFMPKAMRGAAGHCCTVILKFR